LSRLLVVLDGSPLPDGSVARMLGAAADGAREAGGDVRVFRAYDLAVRPCVACGPDATPGYCIFHDDMDAVYEALERAHAVLVGSPVYFDTVSGPLKLVMDRCNCLTPLVTLADGRQECVPKWPRTRRGGFVTACSASHTHDLAERSVRGFLRWVGAKWEATVAWSHADNERGSVPADTLAAARALGQRLVAGDPLSGEASRSPEREPS
jgi:NAD(P)H-dependent FMN reductase